MILATRLQRLLTGIALATAAEAQNSPADGSFQVRYAVAAKAPFVIYSTNNTITPKFDSSTGYFIQTTAACTQIAYAMQFVPTTSGTLQGITAALASIHVNSASFHVLTDAGGSPGAQIDAINFTNISSNPALVSAPSTLNPVLVAGTPYWLSADPFTCTGSLIQLSWHLADPLLAGTYALNGSPVATPNIAAFALTGLTATDSVINFTNTGATNAQDICVNTYTFAPDEQLISCCSCRVTRNALWSLAVGLDLTSNSLTPAVENSVVVKLLATAAPAAGSCNPATPGAPVQGLAAWGTTFHLQNATSGIPYASETPFTNSTLSTAEQTVMTSLCGFIQANGSGFGICRSCRGAGGGRIPIVTGSQNRGLSADKQ